MAVSQSLRFGGDLAGDHFRRDAQDRRAGVGRERGLPLQRRIGDDRLQLARARCSASSSRSFADQRHRARVAPGAARERRVVLRPLVGEDVVPLARTAPSPSTARRGSPGGSAPCRAPRAGSRSASLLRRLERQLALAARRRAHPDEVQVVRVVAERIDALRAALRDVVLVGLRRELVRP